MRTRLIALFLVIIIYSLSGWANADVGASSSDVSMGWYKDLVWDSGTGSDSETWTMASVAQTIDSGYILAGLHGAYTNGDFFPSTALIRTDSAGAVLWKKVLGPQDTFAGSARQTSDGGYVVVGDGAAGFLLKVDTYGSQEWRKEFPDASLSSLTQAADGGYVIVGTWLGERNHAFVAKIDGRGNMEWMNSDFKDGNFHCVKSTSDGGYVLTGRLYEGAAGVGGPAGFDFDMWLVKVNESGQKQWESSFGGVYPDAGRYVQETADGGFIVVGDSASYRWGEWDPGFWTYSAWLIKTDGEGIKQWDRYITRYEQDVVSKFVEQNSDGGYFVAGIATYNDYNSYAVLLTKIDANGNKLWDKLLETDSGFAWLMAVSTTTDGGYILTGDSRSLETGKHGVFLEKLNGSPNMIDKEAPKLAPVADKTILWPPNHKMVPVTVAANPTDNRSGPIQLRVSIVCNESEPGIDYWTAPIINQATGVIALNLMADRFGNGSGRQYTVKITATDGAGNIGTSNLIISVPHDQKKK